MKTASVVLGAAMTLLGLAAMAIGAMIFVLGPSTTAQVFAGVLSAVADTPAEVDGLAGADIDSEMRFYAVLWIAYGALALWVSQSVWPRITALRMMLGVFFLGGVGRALSHLLVGAPHPLFSVLMWLELVLPPLLIAATFMASRPAAAKTRQ